jgi:hypothetical protein
MTTFQDLQQTISRYIKGGRERRRLKRELAQLAAMGDLDAVLADVGLARSQIGPLVAAGADSGELLERMLARLGLDANRLPVETRRDMQWTCMTCRDKRHCRHWLADVDQSDFHGFCPNAPELDRALAMEDHLPPPREGRYIPSADELRRLRGETRRREVRAMLDSGF